MLTAYDCNCGQHSLMQLNGLPCWQKLPAWALSVQNQINMSSLLSLFSTWFAKRRKAISCTGYRETFCHHSFTEANTPRLTCLSSGFRHGLDVFGVQMLSRDQWLISILLGLRLRFLMILIYIYIKSRIVPSFEAEMTKKARQTYCVGFWNKWNGKQKHKNFSWHITQKSCLGTTKVRHIGRFMALLRFQSFQPNAGFTYSRTSIIKLIPSTDRTKGLKRKKHVIRSGPCTEHLFRPCDHISFYLESQPTGGLRLEHHCLRLVDEV